MNKFVFDVDGTLTPSRSNMSGEFQNYFVDFCYGNDVYLVTGSDYPKTLEQVGKDVCEAVVRIYNCLGNDVWEKGINTYTTEWKLPEEAKKWLEEKLAASEFSLRTGIHFEDRPGMCNFSIVGRGADKLQRAKYVSWDTTTRERETIAKEFEAQFPTLSALVGGETGIDIFPVGYDKSQIISDFSDTDKIYFFGDRCDPAGNDYSIAQLADTYFHVKSWNDTWERLQYLQEAGIAL